MARDVGGRPCGAVSLEPARAGHRRRGTSAGRSLPPRLQPVLRSVSPPRPTAGAAGDLAAARTPGRRPLSKLPTSNFQLQNPNFNRRDFEVWSLKLEVWSYFL